MRLTVLISEGEDGWLVVECPSNPGCISQGKTLKEALGNIKEAIKGCLEVMEERVKAFSWAGDIPRQKGSHIIMNKSDSIVIFPLASR